MIIFILFLHILYFLFYSYIIFTLLNVDKGYNQAFSSIFIPEDQSLLFFTNTLEFDVIKSKILWHKMLFPYDYKQ